METSFSSKREKESKEKEQLIQELYHQIGQLKVEPDFLKKTKFILGREEITNSLKTSSCKYNSTLNIFKETGTIRNKSLNTMV